MASGAKPLTIAILGTGAIARYWAFRLSPLHPMVVGQAPPPYRFVDEATQADQWFHPSYLSWQDRPSDSQDVVILAIKWRRMPDAVRWIGHHAPDSYVVSVMNGMGQEQALEGIPGIRVAAGTTTVAVTRKDRTIYLRSAGTTTLPQTGDPREHRLQQASRSYDWGWEYVPAPEMEPLRWQKLLQNSIINPLTALADCSNGRLPDLPLWRLAEPVMQEGVRAARCEGIELPPDMLERVKALARQTRDNVSSMVQDVRGGMATEVNAINGFIVKTAQYHGWEAPVNRSLVTLIEALAPSPQASR